MALVCLCDGGCGSSGDPSAFKTLGVVIKRQYCETCAKAAEVFIAQRDALHSEAAALWRDGLAKHLAAWAVESPGLKLPDVADA